MVIFGGCVQTARRGRRRVLETPQVMVEIVEAMRTILVDVLVPQETVEVVRLIPQERIQQRTVEQTVLVPVDQIIPGACGVARAKYQKSRRFRRQWRFHKCRP